MERVSIQILGRSLRRPDEGLEYEASDTHRQALLEGWWLSEESKMVNSAAVKPEEIGQEEDANMLDEAERKKFRSLVEPLNHMSLDTRGSWKRVKKTARYLKGEQNDGMKGFDVHVDSDWAKGPEKSTRRADHRHSGEAFGREHRRRVR